MADHHELSNASTSTTAPRRADFMSCIAVVLLPAAGGPVSNKGGRIDSALGHISLGCALPDHPPTGSLRKGEYSCPSAR